MSKIIVFNKCEGFCKNRCTKSVHPIMGGDPPNTINNMVDFIEGTDCSSLHCQPSHWFLFNRNGTNWFKKTFSERCPFMKNYSKRRRHE
jgi:hypothetical protein